MKTAFNQWITLAAVAFTATSLPLYENTPDKSQARLMVDFKNCALTDGQKFALELGYAPLPAPLVEMELTTLQKIRVGKLSDS